jgi:hypothetical protein
MPHRLILSDETHRKIHVLAERLAAGDAVAGQRVASLIDDSRPVSAESLLAIMCHGPATTSTGAHGSPTMVKAAATNAMEVFTGVAGSYDAGSHCYRPPAAYGCWEQVVS